MNCLLAGSLQLGYMLFCWFWLSPAFLGWLYLLFPVDDANMKHQPIVEELIGILEVKPQLKKALEESIF